MKLIPITNTYRSNNIKRSNVVTFEGIFNKESVLPKNSESDLVKKFEYGLAGLDDNTILVVCSNKENAIDYYLPKCVEKIDLPIHKIITLQASINDDENQYVSDDFIVYKKNGEYKIIPIGYSALQIQIPGAGRNPIEEKAQVGKIYGVKYDSKVKIGGTYFPNPKYFVFKQEYYNPSLAEKYLQVETIVGSQENIAKFNSQALATIRSNAKMKNVKTDGRQFTFSDIGGLDKQIEECKAYITRPINYPEVYKDFRLNKGILFYGPPRCGKTLLGKAIANETGAKYCYVNGNEFKGALVGSSEENIRKVFDTLLKNSPSILFIDEFDSIGKARDGSSNARYDDSVVNQILGCMSDLEKSDAMSFVIAATNRKDLLDPALLASGRFGMLLEIPKPNKEGISQIFDIHSKNKPFDNDISKQELVTLMLKNEFNGSDVAESITNAYFNALERLGMYQKMDAKLVTLADIKNTKISQADFVRAIEKIAKLK